MNDETNKNNHDIPAKSTIDTSVPPSANFHVFALFSLIAGIIALVGGCTFFQYVSPIFGLIAIVFAIISKVADKKFYAMGILGMIFGIIGSVMLVIVVAVPVIFTVITTVISTLFAGIAAVITFIVGLIASFISTLLAPLFEDSINAFFAQLFEQLAPLIEENINSLFTY